MLLKNHNFIKLQANGIQFIVSQFTTILLFFVISKYLSKDSFALFNWLTALYITIGSLLSFGIEQLIIKSVAEKKSVKITKIYFFHLFITGTLLFVGTIVFYFFSNTVNINYGLFCIWVIVNLFNVALKNSLVGLELFKKIAHLSLIASSIKLVGTIIFIFFPIKSIISLLFILNFSVFLESLLAFKLIQKETDWTRIKVHIKTDYPTLLRSAYPQFVVVLFGVALARFDWIYVGITESLEITADYTFSYKIFEFAKLPLLVISPILMPIFSRIYSNSAGTNNNYHSNLCELYKVELFLAGLLPIIFASFWSPILDFMFEGKYGNSNYLIFCILCLAVPLHYTTDYYWNFTFSKNMYKLNMWISIFTTLSNIFLVLILTKNFSSVGTSIAYSISILITFSMYYFTQRHSQFKIDIAKLLATYGLMLTAFAIIYLVNHNTYITFFIPLAYSIILIKLKFISFEKLKTIFFK